MAHRLGSIGLCEVVGVVDSSGESVFKDYCSNMYAGGLWVWSVPHYPPRNFPGGTLLLRFLQQKILID
jgi:hypothetical protein